ncbi:MAG: hypothetical protein LBF67_05860 [Prevotellaceae bacterium]|jgi:hypothetical protein|nr:hypothetical protein [Prevotellaceae bacterium]
MNQKIIIFLLAGLGGFLGGGCLPNMGGGTKPSSLFLFIGGDTGKVVTIAHLQRPQGSLKRRNEEVTRNVTIPFFEELVTTCWSSPCDQEYVKVSTDGETHAKIVAFDASLRFRRDSSITCRFDRVLTLFPIGSEAGSCYGCENDEYCRSYPIDSLYAYLEKIRYPAYKVIRKGESYAEVTGKDLQGMENPYELSDSAYLEKYGRW